MTTAGFRFIPIDPQVVEPPVAFGDLDRSRPLAEGSVSGALAITWTAETPVCVGDGNVPVMPIRIGGAYALPGASLRGMVRAVAEIATFSHLGPINAARHYGVRTYDYDDMPPVPQRHRPQDLKAGWLRHAGGQWQLVRCQTVQVARVAPRRGEPPRFSYDLGYWLVHFDEIVGEIERRGGGAIAPDQWREMELAEKRAELARVGLGGALAGNRDGAGNRIGPLLDVGPYLEAMPDGVRVAEFGYWDAYANNAQEAMQRRVPGYLVCAGPTEIPGGNPRRAKKREAIFLAPSLQQSDCFNLSAGFMKLFHTLHSNPGLVREPVGNWRYWLAAMNWLGAKAGPHSKATLGEKKRKPNDPDPAAYTGYPGIPVFYHGDPAAAADEAGEPMAARNFFIGLTRVLRLPWPYSVGDVAQRLYAGEEAPRSAYQVPRLGKPGGWDFARALFGAVDDAHLDGESAAARSAIERPAQAVAGRVAFGPAFAEGDPCALVEKNGVFGTPRESYYPFYLARAADAGNSGTQRYDDRDAIPAGRKRYVVRRSADPQLPQGNQKEPTMATVCFLPEGTRFTGRVKFHNLHPTELGALLWALSFGAPGGRYRHQIGRAKAQGYGVLRADIDWRPPTVLNRGDLAGDRNTPETYLDLFRQYMTKKLGTSYEAAGQIEQLRLYADPDVGDRNAPLLATLPLEAPRGRTYPSLKRQFDAGQHQDDSEPYGNGPWLDRLE